MSEPMSDERLEELRERSSRLAAAGGTWELAEALDEIERLRSDLQDTAKKFVDMKAYAEHLEVVRPPAVEARSDDAALVAKIERAKQMVYALCEGRRTWTMRVPANPNDPDIVLSDALDAMTDHLGASPDRYEAGVRAGIAAAADALSPLLAQHACGGGRRFDVPTLESALDAIRALSPEAIAGADTTPSVARLRAIIAEASKQADPAAIEAAAQRFEREMESEPDWKAEALAWRAWYRGAYPSEGPADADDVMVIVSRNEQAERAAAAPETP